MAAGYIGQGLPVDLTRAPGVGPAAATLPASNLCHYVPCFSQNP